MRTEVSASMCTEYGFFGEDENLKDRESNILQELDKSQ